MSDTPEAQPPVLTHPHLMVTPEDIWLATVLVVAHNTTFHKSTPTALDELIAAIKVIAASSLPGSLRIAIRGETTMAQSVSHNQCKLDRSYAAMEQELLTARLEIKLLRSIPKGSAAPLSTTVGSRSRKFNMLASFRSRKAAVTFGFSKAQIQHVHFIDICIRFDEIITVYQETSNHRYSVQLTAAVMDVLPHIIFTFRDYFAQALLNRGVVTCVQFDSWRQNTNHMASLMLDQIRRVAGLLDSPLFSILQRQSVLTMLENIIGILLILLLQHYIIEERHVMQCGFSPEHGSEAKLQIEQHIQQSLLVLCAQDGRLGAGSFRWVIAIIQDLICMPFSNRANVEPVLFEMPIGLYEILWWLSQHLDSWMQQAVMIDTNPAEVVHKLIRLMGVRQGQETPQQHHVYVSLILLHQKLLLWKPDH
ncbi:hypothetical protein BSLG_007097 [Batrachochytrium salamandrivorans]|nr:hypothetical protein BASA62_003920 [Batrachochytrium salamandrivorans]KAH9265006.1 hypothetical protein BASA83_011430 [Batrachochytrium salamandrivorans]KAJ1336313.1 hypothetical protein BSLG_007097 [Batrachochytrium salamandrivorans]